ncbi:MAG TPA: CHAT domain-containing protein [Blastocatellia bacterium]|nr:CHAT domain-containing protein [Blastocatellia bacterium]
MADHTFTASERGIDSKTATHQSGVTNKSEQFLNQALSLAETGDQELARERLSKAMGLWIQMREPDKAARAALLVGDSYRWMKQYRESLYCYKKALEVKPILSQTKAIAFNCIAKLYSELYYLDLAKLYYTKALDQARIAKDVNSQAEAFSQLATLYYRSGERARAIAYIDQARQLNRRQADEDMQAMLLHLTGQIAQEQGLNEDSREALTEALAIYRRTGNVGEQIKVLSSFSDLHLASAQNQAALEQARQAVEMADAQAKLAFEKAEAQPNLAASFADIHRTREWRWRALLALARAQRATGQKELAVKSYFRAISHIEAIWLAITRATDVGAVAFREERQAPYRELVDVLIEQGKISEAYHVTERARSRTILSLMAARRAKGSPRTSFQDETLRSLSISIASLRTQLLSPQISLRQRAKIESEIEESLSALQEAQAKVDMERFKDRLAWFQPVSVKQVQEKLGQGEDRVAEFLLGEKRSFLWLISSDQLFIEILPGRKEIERAVKQYLAVINSKPNNLYLERQLAVHRELAEKLFKTLFGRLAEQFVPGWRLTLVPDGLLHYLPFETLIYKGRYLVEEREIGYLPSAGLLGLLQEKENRAGADDKMDLLAFGDPIFEPGGSKARSRVNTGDGPDQALRASRGFKPTELPRTRDEVTEIANLFEPNRRRMYLGKDSTEDVIKAEPLRRYRRLHLATHGLVDERNPSRSAVILTLDNDSQEDGFLEVSEIAELDLDCDLVVLSACQTGLGRLFSGEGIVGLSRAFLYAGARSVVVSLWNVSDISTARLMKCFYKDLVSGVGNSAALRNAKLQMIRSGAEARHPYYWASFIIVGKQ